MDENSWSGTAGEIIDSSGLGHNGQAISGATTASLGQFNRRGVFDGSNDYVKIPSSSDFDSLTGTISMWVRAPTIVQGDATLLVRGDIDDRPYNGMILQINGNDGHVYFWISSFSGFPGEAISAVPVWDGNWHHIAVTYTKASGGLNQIYIDGVASGSDTNDSATVWNNQPIYIGYFPGVATNVGFDGHLQGDLDEVALFSKALTAAEIQNIYRRGRARLRFQVRSCAMADCSDANWQGPDGTPQSFYDESLNTSLGRPLLALSGLAAAPYFQYRVLFDSASSGIVDHLKSVSVGPDHYFAGTSSIESRISQAYSSLTNFTESLGSGGCAGGVRYILSPDGTTWYYFDGSSWVTSDGSFAQANSAADIQAQISNFAGTTGGGDLTFRALFKSDGTQKCELDKLQVQGL
jgi:hypothetical protein